MAYPLRRTITSIFVVFFGLVLLPACSDNGTGPIKQLEPFVGVWDAQKIILYSPDDPSQGIDLVEQGASYALSILSTGQYTAVFDLIVSQGHQAGEVSLSGTQIILTPTSPPGPSTSGTWVFQGELLIVDAIALIDFDEDGEDDPVGVQFEFLIRES